MNKKLQEALELKKSEDLFYYLKHDGAINFEMKIISGKILYQRNYNTEKLINEKQKIIESIENVISEHNNMKLSTKKNRNKITKNISVFGGFFCYFIISELIRNIKNENENEIFNIFTLSIFAIGLSFIGYQIFTFKKKLNVLMQADRKDCELQEHRLNMIEQEWKF